MNIVSDKLSDLCVDLKDKACDDIEQFQKQLDTDSATKRTECRTVIQKALAQIKESKSKYLNNYRKNSHMKSKVYKQTFEEEFQARVHTLEMRNESLLEDTEKELSVMYEESIQNMRSITCDKLEVSIEKACEMLMESMELQGQLQAEKEKMAIAEEKYVLEAGEIVRIVFDELSIACSKSKENAERNVDHFPGAAELLDLQCDQELELLQISSNQNNLVMEKKLRPQRK